MNRIIQHKEQYLWATMSTCPLPRPSLMRPPANTCARRSSRRTRLGRHSTSSPAMITCTAPWTGATVMRPRARRFLHGVDAEELQLAYPLEQIADLRTATTAGPDTLLAVPKQSDAQRQRLNALPVSLTQLLSA